MMIIMLIARVLLTLAIYSHVESASVPETSEKYSCQEGSQVLKSEHASRDTDCEQSWNTESIPIGSFMSDGVECHSPCINVTAGEIIISRCINATLTVICYQAHVIEYRIHFLGIWINPLPLQNIRKRDRHGIYACLALLLLIFVLFAIRHYISQLHRIRNNGPNHY
ncbi:hypothetical protein PDJAM_G00001510 [Pangasius djambal]|uniref:Uncharacterized protein n=1 Tax=Pangasius djambal TaxID=1691987 RepID=A0ACC5XXG0_9TELE|nr:hypothetical protein [Pangasius djambal]